MNAGLGIRHRLAEYGFGSPVVWTCRACFVVPGRDKQPRIFRFAQDDSGGL